MKRIGRGIGIGLSVLALVCLTGCWDKMELTERAFIMGVAIDKGENDQVVLTVQMYRPTQMPGGQRSRQREAFFQVKVKGNTVLEAARDIPVKLGRKGQWSHCRVIIIGEDIAREKKVDKVLDFLYRDHEPRLNSAIFVAKGKAADYLEIEPYIENTISQQMLQSSRIASQFALKTAHTTLLDFSIQMKSQTGIAIAPYIYSKKEEEEKQVEIAGVAILKKGKLGDILPSKQTEALLMLINEANENIIQVPCMNGKPEQKEAIEVLNYQTNMTPKIEDGEMVRVKVASHIRASIGELTCTDILKSEDEKKFNRHIQETIQARMEKVIERLQEKKLDAIGLGNRIYRQNPKLWKQWKPDWEKRFRRSRFEYEIDILIESKGTTIGRSTFHKPKE